MGNRKMRSSAQKWRRIGKVEMRITRKKSLEEIVMEKEAVRRKVEEKMPRFEKNLAQAEYWNR